LARFISTSAEILNLVVHIVTARLKAHLTEGQEDLSYRVIPREAIIVKDMQVQNPALQFLNGKSCNIQWKRYITNSTTKCH
jgi:hypothetical protein